MGSKMSLSWAHGGVRGWDQDGRVGGLREHTAIPRVKELEKNRKKVSRGSKVSWGVESEIWREKKRERETEGERERERERERREKA